MPDRGTVLAKPFWRRLSDSHDRLLEDFTAVDPTDVRLQDQAMHWEALKPPDHPDALDEVAGHLADVFLVRNGPAGEYVLENLRDVDLMAALSLTAPGAPEDPPGAPPRWEKGVLAGAFAKHKKTVQRPGGGSAEAEAANQIALGWDFLGQLSDHWPVVADLQMPASG
jgi:hypothetical protein